MKFTIDTKILLKNLQLANLTTLTNGLNLVLSGLLFKVDNNEITITSTNNENCSLIKISSVKNIESTGTFLVKGKMLSDIISNLRNDEVTFEIIDDSSLLITSKKFSLNLNLLDVNSFPDIDFNYQDWINIKLDNEFINTLCNKISICAAVNNEYNNILNGILIDSSRKENKIEAIATNSYHLAYLRKKFNGPKFKFVIDVNTLKFINSIIGNNKDIELFINNKNLILKINNNLFLCKLMEGQYPSVYKVLESEYKYNFTISKNLLNNAINKALVITQNEVSPQIELIIDKNLLKLNSKSIEFGTCYEEIELNDINTQNTFKFLLNIKYLNHILKVFSGNDVTFNFISESKQIIINNKLDQEYKFVLLPINQ